MNLPDQYHKIILEEFENVLKLCNGANLLEDKLYFFSASYGIINRIMNLYCDPTLVFMHQVLQSTHQGFVQRLTQNNMPPSISNSFPDKLLKGLFLYFTELIKTFADKDEIKIREVLEKFSNLWYATSGNGFYLFLTEKLIIK